jgi:iron complex outermembrane recepter protein
MSSRRRPGSHFLLALMAIFTGAISTTSLAATVETRVLEEVIVSATRREQTVSEVPLAISAFTSMDLRQRGVSEVSDLAQVSPSLVISTGSSESVGTEVRIRGIGTSGVNPGLEASVGIFIDGIYRSRSGLGIGDLIDIESVEILRGPQGTLFGRNTSAGAISIHTRKPEFEWGGYLEGSMEDYDGYRVKGGLTGPMLDDTLAFSIAGTYHKRDGYIEDRLDPSRDLYDRNRVNGKAQLLWQPSDNLDMRLIVDYKDKDEHCCAADYDIAGPTTPAIQALGGVVKEDPFAYKAQVTQDSEDDLDEWGISLETRWALSEDMHLTYQGAYRDADVYANVDSDTSNVDLVQGTVWDQTSDFTSHELRLNGVSGQLDWLIGGYYYEEDIEVDYRLTYGADFGAYFNLLTGLPASLFPEGAGDTSRYSKQQADGWAVFTHNIIELNDNYDLVLGFRWSNDNKDAVLDISNNAIHCDLVPFIPFCPVLNLKDSRSEDEPTGTIKLVRNLDVGNVYISYARGYKAGGFNLDRDAGTTGFEFDPEIVDSYELGAKWGSANGALQINSAVFYSEVEDFQINEFDGISFSVTNAAKVQSTGAELELSWLPLDALSINLGATYADTHYDEHPGFNNKGQPLEGRQLPFAPYWSATGSVSYEMPVGRFTGFTTLNASYMGEHNTNENLDPQGKVDDYTVVNGRLGLRTVDAQWEVSIWANNLFDEDYHVFLFNTPLQEGSWSSFRGEPRIYGGTIRYSF